MTSVVLHTDLKSGNVLSSFLYGSWLNRAGVDNQVGLAVRLLIVLPYCYLFSHRVTSRYYKFAIEISSDSFQLSR